VNARAVEDSDIRVSENLALSAPPKMEIVADSLVLIVPTEVEFSFTENESAEGKAGGVESTTAPFVII
jgi:hypothetical protein